MADSPRKGVSHINAPSIGTHKPSVPMGCTPLPIGINRRVLIQPVGTKGKDVGFGTPHPVDEFIVIQIHTYRWSQETQTQFESASVLCRVYTKFHPVHRA